MARQIFHCPKCGKVIGTAELRVLCGVMEFLCRNDACRTRSYFGEPSTRHRAAGYAEAHVSEVASETVDDPYPGPQRYVRPTLPGLTEATTSP